MVKKTRRIGMVSAVGLLLISMSFAGCSKTKKSERINFGKGDVMSVTPSPSIEEDNTYNIGDTVAGISYTKENPDNVGVEYIIKEAKIYDSPEQAGIKRDNMCRGYLMNQINAEAGNQEVDQNKLLVCDINIKNINETSEGLHIGKLTLLTLEPETKRVEWEWTKAYFSNPKSQDPENKDYGCYKLLKGENMDTQVAWLVDPSKIDMENLYVAVNYPGDDVRYIQLNLHN